MGAVCRSATRVTTQTTVGTTAMNKDAPSPPATQRLSSVAPTDAASAQPSSATATTTAETTPPQTKSTAVSVDQTGEKVFHCSRNISPPRLLGCFLEQSFPKVRDKREPTDLLQLHKLWMKEKRSRLWLMFHLFSFQLTGRVLKAKSSVTTPTSASTPRACVTGITTVETTAMKTLSSAVS